MPKSIKWLKRLKPNPNTSINPTSPETPAQRPTPRPSSQPQVPQPIRPTPVQRTQPAPSTPPSHLAELGITPRHVATMNDEEMLVRYHLRQNSTAKAITPSIRSQVRNWDIQAINEARRADILAAPQSSDKAVQLKSRAWARTLPNENIILPIGSPLEATVIASGQSTTSIDIGHFYEMNGRLMYKTYNSTGIIRHISADSLLEQL